MNCVKLQVCDFCKNIVKFSWNIKKIHIEKKE